MIVERFGLSGRRARQVTGQHRSPSATSRAMMPIAMTRCERLRRLSAEHPRWGYRLAWGGVRAEGWAVNRKKIQRLWREPDAAAETARRVDRARRAAAGRAPQPCLGLRQPPETAAR
jgi:putative transposase